jgi:hypothetical protein
MSLPLRSEAVWRLAFLFWSRTPLQVRVRSNFDESRHHFNTPFLTKTALGSLLFHAFGHTAARRARTRERARKKAREKEGERATPRGRGGGGEERDA